MSMDSTYEGKTLSLKIYGQSHSETIGVYIKGLPEGVAPDEEFTRSFMARRAPGKNAWSTPRKEADEVIFEKKEDCLHGYIVNTNTKPKDYASIMNCPRPSHADYTAGIIYGDEAARSGGGIFSGRMTAPLCIAGSIALAELKKMGIEIHAHIRSIGSVCDDSYYDHEPRDQKFREELARCAGKEFPAISASSAEEMKEIIDAARRDEDSIGGVIECVIYGMPEGIGGPIFGGIEAKIAELVYAIPAVKGVEFGLGFGSSKLRGSENNDPFFYEEDKVRLKTNKCGGILGGISVGEAAPIVFAAAVKPTPSISREQDTVDLAGRHNTKISIRGRHDPCIVPRAVPVTEAAAAIAIYDMILSRGN